MRLEKLLILVFMLSESTLSYGNSWLVEERPIALQRLLSNIHPAGTLPGTVVASPQRRDPDYFFHWTRDAGLVMDALIGWMETHPSAQIESKVRDFISLSLRHQESAALTGLGEPKFEVDGSPYMGPWGRPQNDGPALRAIALMRYARWLKAQGRAIDSNLYEAQIPARSVIKRDLEYISHHWRRPGFDLWEEVEGDHFYTRMVQRRALVEGAVFAREMHDYGAAAWYAEQASQLSVAIQNHFDSARGLIIPTLNRTGGHDYKNSDLDVAVILGALHGFTGDGFLEYSDPRLALYAEKLVKAFQEIYPVNFNASHLGAAIGRYPEDRYSGTSSVGGNPWVLATLALAELHYRSGRPLLADRFVERVKFHKNADGSLSEQIDRFTGFMTSAADLTWNYAAILTVCEGARLK